MAGKVTQLSDNYKKYTSKIRLATVKVRSFTQVMTDVNRISGSDTVSLGTVEVLYSKIISATKDLFQSAPGG